MKKILTVHVHITETFQIQAKERTVNQILFDGTVEGEIFNGVILPGAVDTQIYEATGGGLDARYTIKGTDCAGEECLLFIENRAKAFESTTQPVITTNSKALAYLNSARLSGTLAVLPEEVHIEIFEE